jgi:LytS/YehU family sensor histidine kinase
LEIEKLRFGQKLSVTFSGLDDIPSNTKLPKLILQPLIENAIKYGVYESIDSSTILISMAFENNALKIQISNSIESDNTAHKGKGIGLQNVKGRLQLIYESNDLLKIVFEKALFQVNLTIPQFETIDI